MSDGHIRISFVPGDQILVNVVRKDGIELPGPTLNREGQNSSRPHRWYGMTRSAEDTAAGECCIRMAGKTDISGTLPMRIRKIYDIRKWRQFISARRHPVRGWQLMAYVAIGVSAGLMLRSVVRKSLGTSLGRRRRNEYRAAKDTASYDQEYDGGRFHCLLHASTEQVFSSFSTRTQFFLFGSSGSARIRLLGFAA